MTSEEMARIVANPKLSNEAVRLILFVASHGEGEHEIESDEIHMVLGCESDTPVYRARKRAERLGYIEWRRGGKGHGNVYRYTGNRVGPGAESKIESAQEQSQKSVDSVLGQSQSVRVGPGAESKRATTTTTTTPTTTTTAGERVRDGPPDTDIARMRSYLGEHADAVDMMLESAEHPEGWIRAVLGKYGPTGTQLHAMAGLAKERRSAALATALIEFATKRKPYQNRHFDGFVRKAVESERDGNDTSGAGRKAAGQASRATGTDDRRSGWVIEE